MFGMNNPPSKSVRDSFILNETCPFCNNSSIYIAMRRMDGIGVCRCSSCDLHFVEKYPEDISIWYGDDYYKKAGGENRIGYDDYSKLDPGYFSWSIALVRLITQSGKLFDIGCSNGRFLKLAQSAGFSETGGVEYNQSYADLCRENGLDVYSGDFLDVNLNDKKI